MAVKPGLIGAMTASGNGSAQSIGSARADELSHQLTVTADMLRRHRPRLSWGWTKLRGHIGHLGMASFYLVASGALGLFAWSLQHGIYHPPPPPGQMYATVFVRDPAAHVRLSADIYPNQPWSDSLTVTVGHPSRGQAGWLLVIECPGSVSQSPAVHLYSEAGLQAQSAATLATIDTGIGNPKRTIMFGCFPAPKSPLGISGYSPSLANVSVAALQLDDGMVGAPGLPVLYARQSNPGGAVSQLVQVFPNVSCPSATPTPVPATSSSATTPTSPSAAATAQPSGGSTAPTPQTSSSPSSSLSPSPSSLAPQPTAPANPGCLHLAPADDKFIQYEVPASESTIETLHHVDYRDYQISMYPTGNTSAEYNGEESIIWNALSAQDPNFGATNATVQLDGQKNLFISGVLWGIVGGAAVACADHFYEAYGERKRKPPSRRIPL
jgi:hypothetical protein